MVMSFTADEMRRFNYALSLAQTGEMKKAAQEYDALLQSHPNNPILLVNHGFTLMRLGQDQEASNRYTAAIDAARYESVDEQILSLAHTNLGVLWEKHYEFDTAIHHFNIAIALYSKNEMALRYLNELKEAGDIDRGIIRPLTVNDTTTPELWLYSKTLHEENKYLDLVNQEILLQVGVLDAKEKDQEGKLIHAITIPWTAIILELEKDPAFLYKIHWRRLEEMIAAAYEEAGWEQVILTPGSGDLGRDIVATRSDFGSIRIYDQVKAFAPHRKVSANDARAMIGVLSSQPNVSKVILTTTSSFAPGIEKELADFIPYRLELRDGTSLLSWLSSIADEKRRKKLENSTFLRQLRKRNVG